MREEAGLLLEALIDLAGAAASGLEQAADQDDRCGGGPECGWCPVCRVAARVRHTDPQAWQRVGEAAGALLAAVREVVGPVVPDPAGAPTPSPADQHRPDQQPADLDRPDPQEPAVQRITVTD